MNVRLFAGFAVLCGLLALSGCANTGSLKGGEKLALYQSAAGKPVSSFNYLGRINGWTPLGENHIVVWTGPREAYLLDFYGPCQDIDFASAITLTSQFSQVHAGFDKVMVLNRMSNQLPCRIKQIRPLDTTKIKAAEKAAREDAQAVPSGT